MRSNSKIDVDSFPQFSAFLHAVEKSAKSNGWRFRSVSDYPEELHAIISQFAEKVKESAPETPLRVELQRAIHLCETEAIRKVMVTTLKELEIWPSDKNYQTFLDDSDLRAMAFALYTHQRSLDEDAVISERHKKLTMTAFFLVDFAHFVGIPEACETSVSGKKTLNEFLEKARAEKPKKRVREKILTVLDEVLPDSVEFRKWFEDKFEWIALGSAFAAGALIAGLMLGKK